MLRGLFALFIFSHVINVAHAAPKEISLIIAGDNNNPYFYPETIKIEQGQSYQITVTNPFSEPYTFYLKDFNQAIHTLNIEGSASVRSESFVIPAYGAVKCLCEAHKIGMYPFYESSVLNRDIMTEGIMIVSPAGNKASDSNPTHVQNPADLKMLEKEASNNKKTSEEMVYIPYESGLIKRWFKKMYRTF